MSTRMHALTQVAPTYFSTPVPKGLLQRKCTCGTHTMSGGQCADSAKKKSGVQRKLTIGASNDPLEQEADRVAEEVIRMADGESGESIVPFRQSIRPGGEAVTRSPILQRAEAGGTGTPETEGETPKEEGSRCPSWRADPESITKRAGEFYARNHLTPPSQATVERIECEPPISNGNYGCYVHFSDGLVLRVIVRETDIVVGTGPGPLTTEHPPPNTPLCWYEYSCPKGDLVLTVKKCQSSKPSGSSSPPAVAQRAAMAGAPTPRNAPPIVHDVLRSPGQPLDAATRAFFEPRFGHDFSRVRVHENEQALQSAQAINAQAYTVGDNIVFGAGQLTAGTHEGRRLIAHELAHVIQQHSSTHPNMIQRALIFGSGYPNPFTGNPAGETTAAQKTPREWFPSSVDFKDTASLSGGGSGIATLKGLIAAIGSNAAGSIKNLDLIGHANGDLFALGGTITSNSVTGSKGGTIGATQLAAVQSDIDKVQDRFAPSGRITIYGCNSGASGVLLEAISKAFKVCARGFKDEITWCLGWQTKPLVINSRGRTLINPSPGTPCDQYNSSVYNLTSDMEDCSGTKPKAPEVDLPKRDPIVPEVSE